MVWWSGTRPGGISAWFCSHSQRAVFSVSFAIVQYTPRTERFLDRAVRSMTRLLERATTRVLAVMMNGRGGVEALVSQSVTCARWRRWYAPRVRQAELVFRVVGIAAPSESFLAALSAWKFMPTDRTPTIDYRSGFTINFVDHTLHHQVVERFGVTPESSAYDAGSAVCAGECGVMRLDVDFWCCRGRHSVPDGPLSQIVSGRFSE